MVNILRRDVDFPKNRKISILPQDQTDPPQVSEKGRDQSEAHVTQIQEVSRRLSRMLNSLIKTYFLAICSLFSPVQ